MSEKHSNVWRVLIYFEYSLIFIFAASGFVSISVFPLLVRICAITKGIKKDKSVIKKKKKKTR